ncbi:MAG: hypothetical protein HeimC2_37620 [Candidatus Heimdallarchaeota archaeon LC_2]|nr:MAG: hypothetical protein HeimC2_37620 [Candidatus Heimdallarchaeota archaeon LC_2]
MDPTNLRLPINLRDELTRPMGKLIKGTIESTIPLLKKELADRTGILVGVGDVTADILVNNDFDPEIVITDGYTKREKLIEWNDYLGYRNLKTHSPAAVITKDAWKLIKDAIIFVTKKNERIHIKVEGEEDLLVLPLLVELPIGSIIVYGQPNAGAVLRIIDREATLYGLNLLGKMAEFV